jgi:hypothetical protein
MESKLYLFPISDLHLEFGDQEMHNILPAIPTNFDSKKDTSCLVIAGDLSYPSKKSFVQFLQKCKQSYDCVLLVSGNHEYYKQGTPINIVDMRIEQLCQQTGCIFLQKGTHIVKLKDDRVVRVSGCTYWSRIHDHNKQMISLVLNDFKEIISPFTKKQFTPNCYNVLHNDHHLWLTKELLEKSPDVVITHHLVSSMLVHEMYKGSPINDGFASDDFTQDQLMIPKLWICGHTHKRMDIKLPNGTRLLTNPIGYKGEASDFEKNLHVVV